MTLSESFSPQLSGGRLMMYFAHIKHDRIYMIGDIEHVETTMLKDEQQHMETGVVIRGATPTRYKELEKKYKLIGMGYGNIPRVVAI